jgi:putative MFS transporter
MQLMSRAIRASEIEKQIDRLPLSRLHLLVLLACGLGFSFDLAEIAYGGILSAVFSAPPYSVASSELGWLLAAVYIGAIFGAPILGWLADVHGRRTVFIWLLVLLGVASIATAFAPDIRTVTVTRGIGGIALGAYPPLMFAFLTDVLPAARRGTLIVMSTALGYVGPPSLIFLVRWLGPNSPYGIEAWRFGFLAAAIGALACAGLFWLLPESARWLVRKGRLTEANAVVIRYARSRRIAADQASPQAPSIADIPREALGSRINTRRVALTAVTYFLTPWATVGFTVLAGAILIQKGVNVQDSMLYIGVSTSGPIIGTLAGGFFVDRFERRTFLVISALAMGIVGIAFGVATAPVWLMTSGVAFNLIVALFLPVLVLHAAEGVSSESRARMTSLAWTANRIGSALVPLLLLPVLKYYGPLVLFLAVGASLMLFISLIVVSGQPNTTGRSVD